MEQILEKFGLHWNLLLAQMINFGILFFVLYKFAYKPILNILDKRREKIEDSLRQAKEIEERTKKLEEEISRKMAQVKKEADAVMTEARDIGERSRNEILIHTNQEVGKMMEKAKVDISQEKDRMMSDIQDTIVKTTVLVVEKILREKLDPKTRESMVVDSFKELARK
ncbi:MAG: F0F1 ATP synthase subunit B [Candidatus Peregrinibacteria bacterium]